MWAHVGLYSQCALYIYTHTNTHSYIHAFEGSEEHLLTGTKLTLASRYPKKLLVGVYTESFVELMAVEWCTMS